MQEELKEFGDEYSHGNPEKMHPERAAAEFGDLLFSLVNFARFAGINPEEALERTNRKFISRFQYLETAASANGEHLADLTLAQMDVYWEQAKSHAG